MSVYFSKNREGQNCVLKAGDILNSSRVNPLVTLPTKGSSSHPNMSNLKS
jgi:hypothetical protein